MLSIFIYATFVEEDKLISIDLQSDGLLFLES
jgi:hypothetical protein